MGYTVQDTVVGKLKKILEKILLGRSDSNTVFADLCALLKKLGFEERINGSHHIFAMEGIPEILNIQPLKDAKAKPYQVKQVRKIIVQYALDFPDED